LPRPATGSRRPLHSPLETIGGGEILDQSRWRLKTGKSYVDRSPARKEEAVSDPQKIRRQHDFTPRATRPPVKKDIALRCGLPFEDAHSLLEALVASKEILPSRRAGSYLSARRLKEAQAESLRAAEQYFRETSAQAPPRQAPAPAASRGAGRLLPGAHERHGGRGYRQRSCRR
jgi:hypothetical protein